jgi:hypothetical protein
MKLKCIKGVATDHYIVCLQDDVVEVIAVDENDIVVHGWAGWCKGHEINFTAKEIANNFCFFSE